MLEPLNSHRRVVLESLANTQANVGRWPLECTHPQFVRSLTHPPLDGSLMCYITYDSVIIQTCISMHQRAESLLFCRLHFLRLD